MNSADFRIGVAPFANAPDIALKVIAGQFVGAFHIAADILSPMENPGYAFDSRRGQYNAALILKELETVRGTPRFADYEKVIAVLDVDLFVPIFSYVLGEARLGGTFALVSLYRLENDLQRAAKIALHEYGHLCNLAHCPDGSCLMHFSKGIAELDGLPLDYCRYCSLALQKECSCKRSSREVAPVPLRS